MFESTVEPRYSETDALGHINNTVLPVWFEYARKDIFNLVHPGLTHHDWPLILAHISVDFIRQIHFGTPVKITTAIKKIGGKSFTVQHEAWQKGELAARGEAIMVWFNHQQQCSNPIPEDVRGILTKHLVEAAE